MASTTTTELGLFKAIPGTAEQFRTSDINSNWDKVDEAVEIQNNAIDALETLTTSGAVYNSTRVAGRRVIVSSSEPTTGFSTGDIWIQA
jgi:hypothetical protein